MESASNRSLELEALAGEFAICRLPPAAEVPAWAAGEFVSVSRTADELSVVCSAANVPVGIHCDRGWTCLKIAGPFDFDQIGVLASVATPLAAAGVGIFVVSTFDTDYLLVKAGAQERALAALTAAGHGVATTGERTRDASS